MHQWSFWRQCGEQGIGEEEGNWTIVREQSQQSRWEADAGLDQGAGGGGREGGHIADLVLMWGSALLWVATGEFSLRSLPAQAFCDYYLGALAVKGELLLRKSWHKSSAELCLGHAVVITGPWVWGENFCKPITTWQQSTPQARFCLAYRHLLVNKCKNGHTTSSVKLNGAPASYRLVIQKHLAWKVHLDGDVAISHRRITVT